MFPTREAALALLDWAEAQNPGPWKRHSLSVARAAERIAAAAGLNAERAFILGALHDIGRYEGPRGAHHIVAGARLLREKGWDAAARICLTHSFPDGDPDRYSGVWDLSPEEDAEVRGFLAGVRFDDEDRLIQLADALGAAEGVVLMEKRLIDVALRHGAFAGLEIKWRAWMSILADFDRRVGGSVYALFPEVEVRTFGALALIQPPYRPKPTSEAIRPDRAEALRLLDWAEAQNPGIWKQHSLNVARAAERIAAAAGLDAERAFVLGALHDIGRYVGRCSARHIITGARLMREKGYDAAARICLTHSFPDKNLDNHLGWDVSAEDRAEVQAFIDAAVYDDYDRLIQLCDALAMSGGVVLMEKRLVDVGLRYGLRPGIEEKMRAFIAIQRDFEARIGGSLYALFPEAAANTLRMGPA